MQDRKGYFDQYLRKRGIILNGISIKDPGLEHESISLIIQDMYREDKIPEFPDVIIGTILDASNLDDDVRDVLKPCTGRMTEKQIDGLIVPIMKELLNFEMAQSKQTNNSLMDLGDFWILRSNFIRISFLKRADIEGFLSKWRESAIEKLRNVGISTDGFYYYVPNYFRMLQQTINLMGYDKTGVWETVIDSMKKENLFFFEENFNNSSIKQEQ